MTGNPLFIVSEKAGRGLGAGRPSLGRVPLSPHGSGAARTCGWSSASVLLGGGENGGTGSTQGFLDLSSGQGAGHIAGRPRGRPRPTAAKVWKGPGGPGRRTGTRCHSCEPCGAGRCPPSNRAPRAALPQSAVSAIKPCALSGKVLVAGILRK